MTTSHRWKAMGSRWNLSRSASTRRAASDALGDDEIGQVCSAGDHGAIDQLALLRRRAQVHESTSASGRLPHCSPSVVVRPMYGHVPALQPSDRFARSDLTGVNPRTKHPARLGESGPPRPRAGDRTPPTRPVKSSAAPTSAHAAWRSATSPQHTAPNLIAPQPAASNTSRGRADPSASATSASSRVPVGSSTA